MFGQVPLWDEISLILKLPQHDWHRHWETRLTVLLKNEKRDGGYHYSLTGLEESIMDSVPSLDQKSQHASVTDDSFIQ